MNAQHYDYLIVGAGMAAACAARGIRERDKDGSIGIVGDDTDPPATRPALSKKLWIDPEFNLQKIWMKPDQNAGAHLHLHHHAILLDRAQHIVRCSNGACFHYGRLLIATGGKPTVQQLPPSERVLYFRTVTDYRRLRAWCHIDNLFRVIIVGGSWLGMELAAALCQQETVQVQWVIAQHRPGDQRFPTELCQWLQHSFAAHGVEIITDNHVLQGEESDSGVSLILEDGSDINADAVVMCTGIAPCTELAQQSDLATDDGIIVNEYLQTTDHDVFAAGDIAYYPDALLGPQRVEHVDNAKAMGRWAGRNMAGTLAPYTYTPYFYTRLFGLDLKGIGQMSTDLQLICHWQAPPTVDQIPCGVIYYVNDDSMILGVALLNIDDADAGLAWARRVINTRDNGRPEALLKA